MTMSEGKVTDLRREIRDKLKRFELGHNVAIAPLIELMYWSVSVIRNRCWEGKPGKTWVKAKKYTTTPDARGLVFVEDNPISSNAFAIEWWPEMKSMTEFIDRVLEVSLDDEGDHQACSGWV
jgi:hypothetical protein